MNGIGLENLDVELNDKGSIKVDAKLKTSAEGLYAAGVCTGDRQLCRISRCCGSMKYFAATFVSGVMDRIPGTTFADLEISSIGLTEKEAMEEFGDCKIAVASQKINGTDHDMCERVKKGFIKIVYKRKGIRFWELHSYPPWQGS